MEAPDPVGDSHDGEGVTSDGGSTALQSEAGPSGVSEREAKKNRRRQLLKKKVQQFELKLADYDRQIKKVTETELTLEEMDSDTSAYLMEDALKRRLVINFFNQQKITRLLSQISLLFTLFYTLIPGLCVHGIDCVSYSTWTRRSRQCTNCQKTVIKALRILS